MSALLSEYFPAAFPALALAHFVALLSPGADFFLIVGHAVRRGLRGSAMICVGIAMANALYILLAIAGWSAIRDNQTLFTLIECLGAAWLCWLGYLLIRSSRQPATLDAEAAAALTPLRQWLAGFCSGMLNPKNFIFYMSLMAGILGSEVTTTQQITCGLWMFLMVLVWDLLVAWLIGHPRVKQCFARRIWLIERGAGLVLLGIGVGIVWKVIL